MHSCPQHAPNGPGQGVANGGFEQDGAGWRYLSTGANATRRVDDAEAHEGKYSYKLTNKSASAPNIYARIVQEVSGLRPYTTSATRRPANRRGALNSAWCGLAGLR